MLPARLVGNLSLSENEHRLRDEPPRFNWFLEPLADQKTNEVEIHINDEYITESHKQRMIDAWKSTVDLRANSAAWIKYVPRDYSLPRKQFFEHSPATFLAYSWLYQDLRRVFVDIKAHQLYHF